MYDWDGPKNATNRGKHGVDFLEIEQFDWSHALCVEMQYVDGEEREKWIGQTTYGLRVVIITGRNGRTRVISLRRVTAHEKRLWRKEFQNDRP